jgi:hypothetical protein
MEFTKEIFSPDIFKITGVQKGPDCIFYDGVVWHRFMDVFYLKKRCLDELSPQEVSSLCRARATYPQLIGPANQYVRELLRSLVLEISPQSLLEIGAGNQPLIQPAPDGMRYVLADADLQVVNTHRFSGAECHHFSDCSPPLPSSIGGFDMGVAVFVFQFKFYCGQLAQLAQCMKDEGVVVGNVYRRTVESRAELKANIESAGFFVTVVDDVQRRCRDNAYWIFSKSLQSVENAAEKLKILNDKS